MSLQPELLAPEPQRTIHGHGTYGWGVDPSSRRVSIAWARCDGATELDRGVRTASFGSERVDARKLLKIYSETQTLTAELAQTCWPGLVWVEQASGKQQNPPLLYALGNIMSGIYAGLWMNASGRPVPEVETIESARWKKRGIGKGWNTLDKDAGDIIRWAAETCGYRGVLGDEADAHGIAEALRRTVRLSP